MMRSPRTLLPLLAAALIAVSAAPASALLGDMRLVTGTLTLWPQEVDGFRVAVVDGDDADRYFVRVTPITALERDVAPGVRVAVVGREGPVTTEITADSIQPRVALAVVRRHGPWRLVTGIVESVSGSTLTLRGDQGRLAVGLSGVGPSSVPVAVGDRVTVVGLAQGEGKLAARGIARDATSR